MQKLSNRYSLIIKFIVSAILVAVPLYPKFPFLRIPQTFVSVRLEDLLIFIAALIVILPILKNLKTLMKDTLILSIFLYLAIGGISLISSLVITKTVSMHIGFLHWTRRIEYFVPFFLGYIAVRNNQKDISYYLKILLLVMIAAFVFGLGQRYWQWPIIVTQNQEYAKGVALKYMPGSHINSTFAGHYDLATFLVFLLPIVISLIFIFRNKMIKFILFLVWFSSLWLLVNTASRISLLSYLLSSVISLFLIKKYKAIPLIIFVSLSFIVFSANLQDRYQRIWDLIGRKLGVVQNINKDFIGQVFAQEEDFTFKRETKEVTPTPLPVFEDRSSSIRLNVEWPRAIRAFMKNPLLGTGYSSITLATDNDYLRAIGEVGLLGFLGFLLIFINIFINLFGKFPFDNYFKGVKLGIVTGYSGGLFGVFTNAFFIDVFEASKFALIFWLITGFVISLVHNKK